MKRLRSLLFVLLVSVLITGCSSSSKKNEDNTKKEDEKTSEVSYPLTVSDQIGREVKIEKEPKKVVTTYYITTTTVIGVGGKDKLAGIEGKADMRNIYSLAAPEVQSLPSVGSLKELNIEAVLSIKPDVVILNIKQKDFVDQLEAAGIAVIVVNPESDKQLNEMITLFGKVLNKEKQATELNTYIVDKTKEIEKKIKGVDTKSVYFGGNSDFTSTAGSKMFQSSLVSDAGGKNVAEAIEDTYWATVSLEDVANWNPDAIIIAADATYDKDSVQNETALQGVKAIEDKAIYKLPNNIESWDSPIPSSILGKAYIASVLYPEKVSKDYYESMVKDFYSKFYGFEASVE